MIGSSDRVCKVDYDNIIAIVLLAFSLGVLLSALLYLKYFRVRSDLEKCENILNTILVYY